MIKKQKNTYFFSALKHCISFRFKKREPIIPIFGIVLLTSLLAGVCSSAVAQNPAVPSSDKRIGGTVSYSKGELLPRVSVTVKGSSTGTTTDLAGKYAITVPNNGILVFTSISYVTREVAIRNQTIINVQLSDSTTSLNDVVVIGYGTQKKSVITGAISSVKATDIENQQITRLEQALQGRTSGVTIAHPHQVYPARLPPSG